MKKLILLVMAVLVGVSFNCMAWKQADVDKVKSTGSCPKGDSSEYDFTQGDTRKVDLSSVNLTGANLNNANLQKANLKNTVLLNANLEGARLTRLSWKC